MKTTVYLFTDGFPFGKGEPFLETEIKYLSEQFGKIVIIPLENYSGKSARSIPENTVVLPSVFSGHKYKLDILHKGLFNLSPVWDYVKEFFRGKAYTSVKKIWMWGTFLLVTRAGLAYLKSKKLPEKIKSPDICYFYWGLRWSQVLPFMKNFHANVFVRFHGSDIYEDVNSDYIPMRARQLASIRIAIFISQCGYDYLTGKYPFIKSKSCVSRLGTMDYGLNPFKRNHIIQLVSCSNLVRVKRVALIAQCLRFIDIKLKWIHIGDGPEMKKIKRLAENLPENVEVNLTGSISHDDLMKLYQSSSFDAFINVSSSEGVPVSIMEALSFGIPVIATDVGGVSEITDNETGILIPSDISPESLSGELKKLLARKDYADMRVKARERWEERCNAEKIYPEFCKLLLET